MSPLEILRRSFRPISLPRPGALATGVYFLIDQNEIVYCGSSRTSVFIRVAGHMYQWQFDEAIWYPIPASLVFDYEGAFIRGLDLELERAPKYRGFDNEILEGFGLQPIADPEAVAEKWRLRHARSISPDGALFQ